MRDKISLNRLLTGPELWDTYHSPESLLQYNPAPLACCVKKNVPGAREMTQWLRALAALPENSGSIPRTYMGAHNCL